MIPWLEPGEPFPPVEAALVKPNGLLAASRELTPAQLVDAYRRGIFPWYSQDEPVLWWSPDPRMVMFPHEFDPARSLRKRLRAIARQAPDGGAEQITVTLDRAFERVMRRCAEPRPGQDGTWITEEMVRAYVALHRAGLAHSVEVWHADLLAGGLYGVAIGRAFYGESMFTRQRDASKVAFAALIALLLREQVRVIDCQQRTAHLASLGAREIPRREFSALLAEAVRQPSIAWSAYVGSNLNHLLAGF
jgi:leucyl/phenylalanyl-tRNA--protein transferase